MHSTFIYVMIRLLAALWRSLLLTRNGAVTPKQLKQPHAQRAYYSSEVQLLIEPSIKSLVGLSPSLMVHGSSGPCDSRLDPPLQLSSIHHATSSSAQLQNGHPAGLRAHLLLYVRHSGGQLTLLDLLSHQLISKVLSQSCGAPQRLQQGAHQVTQERGRNACISCLDKTLILCRLQLLLFHHLQVIDGHHLDHPVAATLTGASRLPLAVHCRHQGCHQGVPHAE
mmetsp:Transcript_18019/g.30797  ORF Transcript_18019/g.30797 Transcript_18019/m.30797 type:complete len:224 (-) Transcript_18019:1219-1890(-)